MNGFRFCKAYIQGSSCLLMIRVLRQIVDRKLVSRLVTAGYDFLQWFRQAMAGRSFQDTTDELMFANIPENSFRPIEIPLIAMD